MHERPKDFGITLDCIPYCTWRESQQRALGELKTRANLVCADVRLILPERCLEFNIQPKGRIPDGLESRFSYVPWPKFFPHIYATDQHLELFDLRRTSGIVARWVRRGYVRGQKRQYDLAQFVFRLPDPFQFWWDDGCSINEPRDPSHIPDPPPWSINPPIVGDLLDLITQVTRVRTVLGGATANIHAARWGNRFVRIGSAIPKEAAMATH